VAAAVVVRQTGSAGSADTPQLHTLSAMSRTVPPRNGVDSPVLGTSVQQKHTQERRRVRGGTAAVMWEHNHLCTQSHGNKKQLACGCTNENNIVTYILTTNAQAHTPTSPQIVPLILRPVSNKCSCLCLRLGLINQPNPQRWQSTYHAPGAAVCTTHLQEALETHLESNDR
jgi:uncharacterized protein YheU (UPF0270 family)